MIPNSNPVDRFFLSILYTHDWYFFLYLFFKEELAIKKRFFPLKSFNSSLKKPMLQRLPFGSLFSNLHILTSILTLSAVRTNVT